MSITLCVDQSPYTPVIPAVLTFHFIVVPSV